MAISTTWKKTRRTAGIARLRIKPGGERLQTPMVLLLHSAISTATSHTTHGTWKATALVAGTWDRLTTPVLRRWPSIPSLLWALLVLLVPLLQRVARELRVVQARRQRLVQLAGPV
jgi:hypothetical protein